MKNLFNYASIKWYEDELKRMKMTLPEYIASIPCHIDGIEQYIYTKGSTDPVYPKQSLGVHLEYWTYWLDFWLNDEDSLAKNFADKKEIADYYSGASDVEQWLNIIRENIKKSLANNPEYLVWHVADANFIEMLTEKCRHTDRQVLSCSADVFREVSDVIPDDVSVLFENLWFPGLHVLNRDDVDYFFNRIKKYHQKAGIMLDTGHLMNTNTSLRSEAEAARFICQKIDSLGDDAELIKGIHLSKSLSGEYQRNFKIDRRQMFSQRYILNHIVNVDMHQPFITKAADEIVQKICPNYIVHEFNYGSLAQLRRFLLQQTDNIQNMRN